MQSEKPSSPLRGAATVVGLFVCAFACASPAHVFFVERTVLLPARPGQTNTARVRERLYLLGNDDEQNRTAVARALLGEWDAARRTWESLAANDCRAASNLALARYVQSEAGAFDSIRGALFLCPQDDWIRWNFQVLARPRTTPPLEYSVEP